MNTEPIEEQDPALPNVQQIVDQLAEQLPADIDALHAKMTELEQQARVFIQERPMAAVLAAVGIGYLVARLAPRGPR